MLALLLTVPLALASTGSSGNGASPAAGSCIGVWVSSPQAGPNLPRNAAPMWSVDPTRSGAPGGPSFSASRILNLEFSTLMPRRSTGPHVLDLRVYAPRGHLYQVVSVPFTGVDHPGDDPRPRPRWVEGHPRPLPEETLQPVSLDGTRGFAVRGKLPVAGTAIVTSSLYGDWSVVPHLDGQGEACGPARHFTIRQ